jgi:hypothetical protein
VGCSADRYDDDDDDGDDDNGSVTVRLDNDQRNAQVYNLFIYLLLPYMFRAFF